MINSLDLQPIYLLSLQHIALIGVDPAIVIFYHFEGHVAEQINLVLRRGDVFSKIVAAKLHSSNELLVI
jgi:hypothetical protein